MKKSISPHSLTLSISLVAAFALALGVASGSAFAQDSSVPEHPVVAKDQANKSVQNGGKGALIEPRVFFIGLKDGAKVKSPLKIKFGVKGMKVEKAGAPIPGSGHHHLIIDGGPTPKGTVVPKDDKHLHFGDGQTETTIKLDKGRHTLTMQFADGAHSSYGEELSDTIVIEVR